MQLILNWKDLSYLLSVFVGLLVGLILILFGYKKKKDNILIGFSFVFLSYAVFLAFLIYSGYHLQLPHLYRTGNIAALSFAPLAYLYIRKVAAGMSLTKFDVIHLLPALIYLIDFFPVIFLTSLAEKTELIRAEIDDPLVFVHFNQSRLFPAFFYTLMRTALIFIYWVLSLRILRLANTSMQAWKVNFGKEWVTWMRVYTFCMMFLFLPYLLLFKFVQSDILFDLIHLTGAFLLLLSGISVLFFPEVLYGINDSKRIETVIAAEPLQDAVELFPPDKEQLILDCLHAKLDSEKSYLQKQYAIGDLARETSIPAYILTKYINRSMGTNFSDLVNKYRVEECCRLMASNDFQNWTLDAIADHCGFNNRNSFYKAFKKNVGQTPAQYFKSLNS